MLLPRKQMDPCVPGLGFTQHRGERLPKGSEEKEEKEKKDEKREEKKEGAASRAGSMWESDGGNTTPSWEAPI